ncbi:alpha/beta fold hydrolase [uncultured Aquimarina sp.]|uniref:alpha/beta hydrolase n=1 Tax=uncultured Aquimarina sp. TaxID=575652 RepID=UPI002602D552|nr:alpha/beta fold hydrolase [uncultured Aquimarina sp.]
MKKFIKIGKINIVVAIFIIVGSIIYVRFSRYTDKMIYQTNGLAYDNFETTLNHKRYYFDIDDDIVLHGVLFKPDSQIARATIIHYPGKGMHLMASRKYYEILVKKGFQVFSFERRGFGESTGVANNSLTLKEDALYVFDKILDDVQVKNTPILIWGQSLGGAFATMNAAERNDKITGVILEGTFNSFPDIGKVYANALGLENFKWLIPLLMNNDFSAENEIKKISKPIWIVHSVIDKQVPFGLGKKLYEASDKSNTQFWEIEGKHIKAIFDYEEEYVQKFIDIIDY